MIRTVPDASLRLVDTARATLFDGENALDRGDAAVRGNALAKHLPHPTTHTRQTIVVEADAAGTLDAIHTRSRFIDPGEGVDAEQQAARVQA